MQESHVAQDKKGRLQAQLSAILAGRNAHKKESLLLKELLEHPDGLGHFVSILESDLGQEAPEWNPSRVLFIEDEPDICMITETFFKAKEQPILIAKSLKEARDIVRDYPDLGLIFLDLNLPDGEGLSLLADLPKIIKKDHKLAYFEALHHPDVIVTSAYMDQKTIDKSMDLGAMAYMLKPISLKGLAETIQKVHLRRARLQKIQYLWTEWQKISGDDAP